MSCYTKEATSSPVSSIKVVVGISWLEMNKIREFKIGINQGVRELKQMIAESTGKEFLDISLSCPSYDNLSDCSSLDHYGIVDGTLIYARLPPPLIEVNVVVGWSEQKLKFRIGLYQQVYDLRQLISDATAKPMGAIHLKNSTGWLGPGNLNNGFTLKQYEINNGHVVFAELNPRYSGIVQTLNLVVETQVKILSLKVMSDIGVGDLKRIIQQSERIPADQQRLIFKGKQLEDDRLLRDYGLEDGSKLQLVLRLRGC